eukprot:Colp12_sorted_trinity150504_noHs@10732
MRDGFSKSLMTTLKSLTTEADREEALDALDKFKGLFPSGKLARGDALFFHIEDNSLTVTFKGEVLGRVQSRVLCQALVTQYLRSVNPISSQARANIMDNLCQRLKGH